MNKFARLSVTACLLFAAGQSQPAEAQETARKAGSAADASSIERGRYIVENVAMCGRCHTPRDEKNEPERSNWLMGAPIQKDPTYPEWNYAIRAPRIAGRPPGTDAEVITLLTTGIARTGKPPLPPMLQFHMTRQDAESVLAYLKSLRR